METNTAEDIRIVNTTHDDLNTIYWLFDKAMELQEKNNYRVWDTIDKIALQKDIHEGLQYKVVKGGDILCIFSIQQNDPFIWRDKDRGDAIYLHRIVMHPDYKGQRQFKHILNWAKSFASQNNLIFVRMDTWADNLKIIEYYKSFGFEFIENYKTTNATELPIQNRNLDVALLQINLKDI